MSDKELALLQSDTFRFFVHEMQPQTKLMPESTRSGAPSSIAVVGLSLTIYPIAVERRLMTRKEAARRTLSKLRLFHYGPDGNGDQSIGRRGFYYHFLDMNTCQRAWKSEVSTIDTAYLLAGALVSAEYFQRDTGDEREIRQLADALYRRADWRWAQNGGLTITHGWKPESGFRPYRWHGYSEALILYLLALASPTFPVSPDSYRAWTKSYEWKNLYGFEHLYAGPLFIHQLSHIWIDFRGIQDDYMRSKSLDYFENSRRATYAQQQYAIRNPKHFKGYGEFIWGLTGSDGPGPASRRIQGKVVKFYDYKGRSVPYGPDDGTLSPAAMAASLPFAPEIVLPSLYYFSRQFPEMTSTYGFKCSFNPTFTDARHRKGWVSQGYYGLDQGPVVAMIENYRTGFIWRLMRNCRYIREGLRRAGFSGGWL
jgi:hypothetical protein